MKFSFQRVYAFLAFPPQALATLIVITCITFASSIPLAFADDAPKGYAVRLFRPSKVGEKYSIVEKGNETTMNVVTVGVNAPVIQNEDLAAELEATLETLAVDSKGNATKVACTIKKFLRTDGKEPLEILLPGTVVIVDATQNDKVPDRKEGSTEFSFKGGASRPRCNLKHLH